MSDGHRPRIALIVNPVSGNGRAARLTAAVADRLGAGADVRVHSGASALESAELVRAAVGRVEAIVVLGGDGIVNIAVQELALTSTPLGIVPAGTGNDSAASIGLPADPLQAADAVLAALLGAQVRKIDLGRTGTGRWWLTVLCAGFDSAVNERANRLRWPRGPRRYDVAIAAETLRLRPRAFQLCLDGRELAVSATLVAIGNAPQYGGGKRITPHASMVDGRFTITVVGPIGRFTLARMSPTVSDGTHLGHHAVTTYEASEVRLDASHTIAYADGEPMGQLPLSSTCVPSALHVLVPDVLVPKASAGAR